MGVPNKAHGLMIGIQYSFDSVAFLVISRKEVGFFFKIIEDV